MIPVTVVEISSSVVVPKVVIKEDSVFVANVEDGSFVGVTIGDVVISVLILVEVASLVVELSVAANNIFLCFI